MQFLKFLILTIVISISTNGYSQVLDTTWRSRFHVSTEFAISGNESAVWAPKLFEFPVDYFGVSIGSNFRYTPWRGRIGLNIGFDARLIGNKNLFIGIPFGIDFTIFKRHNPSYFIALGSDLHRRSSPWSNEPIKIIENSSNQRIAIGTTYKYSDELEMRFTINRIYENWKNLITYAFHSSIELRFSVYKNFGFWRFEDDPTD